MPSGGGEEEELTGAQPARNLFSATKKKKTVRSSRDCIPPNQQREGKGRRGKGGMAATATTPTDAFWWMYPRASGDLTSEKKGKRPRGDFFLIVKKGMRTEKGGGGGSLRRTLCCNLLASGGGGNQRGGPSRPGCLKKGKMGKKAVSRSVNQHPIVMSYAITLKRNSPGCVKEKRGETMWLGRTSGQGCRKI